MGIFSAKAAAFFGKTNGMRSGYEDKNGMTSGLSMIGKIRTSMTAYGDCDWANGRRPVSLKCPPPYLSKSRLRLMTAAALTGVTATLKFLKQSVAVRQAK
ncbi:hypothetical protein EG328_000792 [Venturia inaequalis]|uniref:Uncharacterized protein n=1 Tax=Venturia inaequalis TaxID=5025 RepID=A0A8H3U316_VENIN|nr:hypothetical protein EG328_000792 [Venturia inaequalis]